MAKHWIKGAIKHPGALHRELGVPEGKKIPAKKLARAEHSSNPTERRRANLAKTLEGMHHGGEHYKGHNPVHDGYGAGNQHNEKTGFGEAIGGGEHAKHRYDKNMHNIAGGERGSEHESKLRSQDNDGEKAQHPAKRTGEPKSVESKIGSKDGPAYEERHSKESYGDHAHHIAGGEHGHHEHGSGKAEHHPSVDHREPHRFHGGRVEGAHGFGHGVERREGHLRHSGHKHAHRIGKR